MMRKGRQYSSIVTFHSHDVVLRIAVPNILRLAHFVKKIARLWVYHVKISDRDMFLACSDSLPSLLCNYQLL